MMYSQNEQYIMPPVDDDEVLLWDIKGAAYDAARDYTFANALSLKAYEVGV